ncbi:interferon-induced protein with tetratricopeptide repeats 5-like [Cololabis saira]|uniref:interferon-induced protein with tetratricopeptide repeats 5-like n=1 Tax=Cololabis saira TaxID=129043 RepID=UPI002AD236F7|nr:interferon-induced protein with tetratricopeptide repeats 5-like [Cololabis saira]
MFDIFKRLPFSAAQDPPTLESRLKDLECHFTWDLDSSRSKLIHSRYMLEDIGTEEGNLWLGHIYNLQGFIWYQLGDKEKARRFLRKATEAFRQLKNTDEGPWLVVNFGNLAWLHHLLGEDEQSQDYLSKVDALLREHPSPSQDELHPEICAEKAWTLMKFDKDKQQQAADYFQRAVEMQLDMVHWRTSRVIGRVIAHKHDTDMDQDIWKEMREARELDPDNTNLAALELLIRAKRGDQVKEEVRELEEKILLNPVSSYSGINLLLKVYRQLGDNDQAIDLAERVLKNHPDNRYLKVCAAHCYRWRIFSFRHNRPNPSRSMVERAISLHEQAIALYPDRCPLRKKLDLADICAKTGRDPPRADQIYQELLTLDLEPADKQQLYNRYANYLHFNRREPNKSITYHMKTAEIPLKSYFRWKSIRELKRIGERGNNWRCGEIRKFLETLQEEQPESAVAPGPAKGRLSPFVTEGASVLQRCTSDPEVPSSESRTGDPALPRRERLRTDPKLKEAKLLCPAAVPSSSYCRLIRRTDNRRE